LAPFWTRARRLLWSWWPWSLAAVWFASAGREGWSIGMAIVALYCYLAAPVETPPKYGLDHELSVDSGEFLTTIAGATGEPFVGGNSLVVLNNGDEFYPAMLDAIAGAERSITIEAYIYWEGDIGRRFAQALAKKARQHVRVKILLDAFGSASIGDEIVGTLEQGGCQLAWYNPLRWYSIGRYNHRTHRKSLIVDGRIAFTGGAGIADKWLGNARNRDEWRDIQIRLEGPAVTPLQTGFAQNWLETTAELLSGPLYYPRLEAAGPLNVLTVISTPVTGASTARIIFYLSIASARQSIYLATPYFIPDPAATETLIDARRRGVDVRIMVAGRSNDQWVSRHNAVRHYGPLLEAGIEILEFHETLLHQKTLVVDGVWVSEGTSNFDSRSFAHNEENLVCVHDRELARRWYDIFFADAKRCEPVRFEAWRHRGAWARVQELIAAFLTEQV
jgi:cardiolipin synthase